MSKILNITIEFLVGGTPVKVTTDKDAVLLSAQAIEGGYAHIAVSLFFSCMPGNEKETKIYRIFGLGADLPSDVTLKFAASVVRRCPGQPDQMYFLYEQIATTTEKNRPGRIEIGPEPISEILKEGYPSPQDMADLLEDKSAGLPWGTHKSMRSVENFVPEIVKETDPPPTYLDWIKQMQNHPSGLYEAETNIISSEKLGISVSKLQWIREIARRFGANEQLYRHAEFRKEGYKSTENCLPYVLPSKKHGDQFVEHVGKENLEAVRKLFY
jgi:hypothetical protein